MKILELPSQNCSKVYNENNLNKFLPQKKLPEKQLPPQQQQTNQQSASSAINEPQNLNNQGFQGQPGKERKSHNFKSHSPQPEFHSDQAKSHNKNIQKIPSHTSVQHTHSSENLAEKEFDPSKLKVSMFKTNQSPKKKESVNLFEEEEEKKGEKLENGHKGKDNLMLFSPSIQKTDVPENNWMDKDKFMLDQDLVGVISGEEIAELKRQYVKQKVENKVIERKINII